jgi:4-hydroxy-tetrahydrodipicolinate synthase
VAAATRLPVAIQNAPEFLGIGLTADELIALHERAPNVTAVKGEASATIIARRIVALGGRMPVLNGRAGQELTDKYRAGVAGMIPGSRRWTGRSPSRGPCWRAKQERADDLYAELLPVITFIMQSLSSFLTTAS